jgi:hypothetical protein
MITQCVNMLRVANGCQKSEIRTKRSRTSEHEMSRAGRDADAMSAYPAVAEIP